MRRSTSFVCTRILETPQEDKPTPDYKQFVYVNTEEAHKEKHTIFHSPYKAGKRNPSYVNPSFMSSDVFYPRDYSANNHSQTKPRVALIPTKNDLIQEQQYQTRMLRKSYSGACLNKQSKNGVSRKALQPLQQHITSSPPPNLTPTSSLNPNLNLNSALDRSPARITNKILRKIEDSKQLRYEIQMLKRSPPHNPISKENNPDECPVYLEGRNTYLRNAMRKENSKRQLVEEMNRALRRKQEEKQAREYEKKNEKGLIDKEAQRFYAGIKTSVDFEKQKARLLSELLLEQILHRN